MADTKISALPASTTPLAGTEVLPIVQSGVTKKVSVADLTAGRAISGASVTASTGNFVVGTSGQGIDFSATPGTGTSELLDDYEEGTWTPTFAATGTGFAALTMDVVSATYTKVGRQVTVRGFIRTDNVDITGATGDLILSGLPFASDDSNNGWSTLSVGFAANWASNTPLYGRVSNGNSYLFLCTRSSLGGADSLVAFSDMTTGASAAKNQLIFSATYFTA